MLQNQANRSDPFAITIESSPKCARRRISFGVSVGGVHKRVIITADVIEEHALRRPMSSPELENYAAANADILVRAIGEIQSDDKESNLIVINRIEQLVA